MAGQTVAGELYYELDGQLLEIKRQLRQPSGYPFDPVALKLHLQDAIEGRFSVVSFARDMRKEGWKLLEHSPRRITSMANLELVPFLKPDEKHVGGEEMVRRARLELAADYGQEDAEWLLEHQDEIPEEFRPFYILFTATVWQDSDGDRHVLFLCWSSEQWFLSFEWLEHDFYSVYRLLRSCKPA